MVSSLFRGGQASKSSIKLSAKQSLQEKSFRLFTDVLVSLHMHCCYYRFDESGKLIWILELWFVAEIVCTTREGERFFESARFRGVFLLEIDIPFARHEGEVSRFLEKVKKSE